MNNFSPKRWLLLVLCCVLIMPTIASGQTDDEIPPLTKTFVAPDKSFSFSYPENWEISIEGDTAVTFSVPLASAGTPNDSGIAIESEGMSVTISIDEGTPGATPEEMVLAQAEPFAEDSDNFTLTEVESNVLSGRPTAFVAVVGSFLPLDSGFFAIDLSDDHDLFMNFWLAGTEDQIRAVFPVLPLIFGTLQMPANELAAPVGETALTETYLGERWGIAFDYPEDWTADEQDTYVLLTVPNGVTLGISAQDRGPNEPADLEALVTGRAEGSLAQLEEALGSPADLEIQIFTVNDLPAARFDYSDGNFQYRYMSVPVDNDLIANVTVIGNAAQVAEIESLISAIVASLRLIGDERQPESAAIPSDELLAYLDPNGLLEFEYPATWELVEEEGFTKLRLPGEVVINVAAIPVDIALFGDDVLGGFALDIMARMQQEDPTLTEDDIQSITLNDVPGFQIDGEVPDQQLSMTNIAFDMGTVPGVQPNQTVLVLVIIVGDSGTFDVQDVTIQTFLKSLHLAQ